MSIELLSILTNLLVTNMTLGCQFQLLELKKKKKKSSLKLSLYVYTKLSVLHFTVFLK